MLTFVAPQVTDTRRGSCHGSQARTAAPGADPGTGRSFAHPDVPARFASQDAGQWGIRRLPHLSRAIRIALRTDVPCVRHGAVTPHNNPHARFERLNASPFVGLSLTGGLEQSTRITKLDARARSTGAGSTGGVPPGAALNGDGWPHSRESLTWSRVRARCCCKPSCRRRRSSRA
jgi:hypothetical protein